MSEEKENLQSAKEQENRKKIKAKENKMGVMPVNRLVITMALPLMISMLVQALYNIVDSIFVAMIEEKALTAVSLAFPMQNVMIAVAMGTCVGMNALVSRSLGEKNPKKANQVATNTIFLAACSYLVFLLIGAFAVPAFYRMQTDDEVIIQYGIQYLQVVCMASFGIFAQAVFERLLQSTGKTVYSMITQGVGAIINIIMDPILIFGLLGFPQMGVRGAAVATVLGQCVGALIGLILNIKGNKEVSISLKGFRPSGRIIGNIYQISVPAIIMQGIGGVMNYGMNQIFLGFSSTATTVFGIYYKLQSIIFMPVFGLNNALVAIISYNYGAGKKERVTKTIRLGILYAECIMIIGFIIMQVAPKQMLLLFSASDDMLGIGVPALRTISWSFLLAGICIPMSGAFQALGRAWYSMVNSVCRQVVILLPCAWLLSRSGILDLVWWSFPIAEFASLLIQLVFFHKVNKEIISHIGETKGEATA